MNLSPLFSVLLPTHNRADVIGYAIQSALNQSCRDFELLVVGDGCTDNTAAIVQKFAEQDNRVRWFSFPKTPGFGYINRNKALRQARGKLVAYLGHDDLWLPDHLALMAEYFREQPRSLMAYTRPLWMINEGLILPSFFNTAAPTTWESFLHQGNEIPAACVVVRRGALAKAGYWIPGTKNAGDWDLWRRILSQDPGQRPGFLPTPTAINFTSNWRTESEALTGQLSVQRQALKASPHLLDIFRVRRSENNVPWQAAVWREGRRNGWFKAMIDQIDLVEDELLYRLTEDCVRLAPEDGIIALIMRVKRTAAYERYLNVRRKVWRWRKGLAEGRLAARLETRSLVAAEGLEPPTCRM